MADTNDNRRSVLNSLRVEEDFTNRQIVRVVWAASLYVAFATFLLCVFYTYILNPVQIGNPSLLSFPEDFRLQWRASAELRGALRVWLLGMVGMTSTFAIATGLVLSRKIAGPIHRLKTDLRRMRDGDAIFAISLREGDELQDLTQIINETLVVVQQRGMDASSMGSNAGTSELEADERLAALASLRSHLESLPVDRDGSPGLIEWSDRARDLIAKVESNDAS